MKNLSLSQGGSDTPGGGFAVLSDEDWEQSSNTTTEDKPGIKHSVTEIIGEQVLIPDKKES